jgi:hypothetical protein
LHDFDVTASLINLVICSHEVCVNLEHNFLLCAAL